MSADQDWRALETALVDGTRMILESTANDRDSWWHRAWQLAKAIQLEDGSMDQKPSVGRVVHYVAYGTPGGEFPAGVCRAATITEVGIPLGGTEPDPDERVGLFVMNPTGCWFNQGVKHDENKAPGTWHWPERV